MTSANVRAAVSAGPPALNGTMMVTARDGNSCAGARDDVASATSIARNKVSGVIKRMVISFGTSTAPSLVCLPCRARGPRLRRTRPHRFGLERTVSHLQISFGALLALRFEKPFPVLVVRGVDERAQRAIDSEPCLNAGRLHALHHDRLVEADRRLGYQRDAARQLSRFIH